MRRWKHALIAGVCAVALVSVCGSIGAVVQVDPRAHSWSLIDIRRTDSNRSLVRVQSSELPFRYGSLEFTPTRVHGKAACNTFSGAYQLNPATRRFAASGLALTQIDCGGRAGILREATFLAHLRAANRYEVIGGELRLYADAEKTVLVFRRNASAFTIEQLTRLLGSWIRQLFA